MSANGRTANESAGDARSRFGNAQLIAQRGNSIDFPENTLLALSSALELGARSLYIDVLVSSDNVPFAVRDSTPYLSFNDRQRLPTLAASAIDELQLLEATRQGVRIIDVGIPRLSHVARLCTAHPGTYLLLHLQQSSLQRYNRAAVIDSVCKAMGAEIQRVIWITGDLPTIELLRSQRHEPVGWVVPDFSTLSQLKCEALTPNYLLCEHSIMQGSVDRLWRGPWRWAIETAGTMTDVWQLTVRGAHYIVTPHIRALLREQRQERLRN